MERRWWIVFLIVMSLSVGSTGRGLEFIQKVHTPLYNHTLATILVEYASAVYISDLTELFTWTCSRCNGLTKGFEVIELIVDVQNCLQAFVGVADDLDAIVLAFRSTQETSIQNWIEDLFWKQLDFDYPGCTDGKLIYGSENVQVMTFEQPRIGNAAFASYYYEVVPNTFRVTHEHDPGPTSASLLSVFPTENVSSLPKRGVALQHWIRISYNEQTHLLTTFANYLRSVSGNTISDHLTYFGVEMGVTRQANAGL